MISVLSVGRAIGMVRKTTQTAAPFLSAIKVTHGICVTVFFWEGHFGPFDDTQFLLCVFTLLKCCILSSHM